MNVAAARGALWELAHAQEWPDKSLEGLEAVLEAMEQLEPQSGAEASRALGRFRAAYSQLQCWAGRTNIQKRQEAVQKLLASARGS